MPIDREVKVIRVGDGDTIEVTPLTNPDRKEKVRLLGVERPGKGEKLYTEGPVEAPAAMVADKTVTLEFEVDDVPARDESNRVLAYVFVDDANVCVETARQGWSPFSTRHGGARFAADLNEAEAEAKYAKSGVWAGK